jgi:hypothetical protein
MRNLIMNIVGIIIFFVGLGMISSFVLDWNKCLGLVVCFFGLGFIKEK